MNCKIPFIKDIDFEKKLYEITSISLEHELDIVDNTLKGNFIVSGDFKSHEVSVNKEPFSYLLPFEIEISSEVDHDTIEFMIEDFTYEIVDSNVLRVKIDFNVIGSKKEIEKASEEIEEAVFRDASEAFSDEQTDALLEEIIDEKESDENIESVIEETVVETREEVKEEQEQKDEKREQVMVETKEKKVIENITEDTIIESVDSTKDEYATYHIHMVNDGETIETICTMYNSNLNILSEYNDLTDVTSGDKLIIPEENE